ncbi:MAG: peroxiredoxin family protein [Candidatus Bipolaricaulis sp.]|nr:peroxiredoxin family protein [Candidatus Bipolaricaulis sp.]
MTRDNKLLKVGDRAPEFALPDALTGEVVKLADLLVRPLLLYFGRGTWCPTCRMWLAEIEKNMAELAKRGAGTATIMAQSPASMKAYLEANRYPFPVLADASREVVKQYGVYVRANFESINIARPANFVLDRQGTIRFMHIASIQVEHASFPEILTTLDSIAGR